MVKGDRLVSDETPDSSKSWATGVVKDKISLIVGGKTAEKGAICHISDRGETPI